MPKINYGPDEPEQGPMQSLVRQIIQLNLDDAVDNARQVYIHDAAEFPHARDAFSVYHELRISYPSGYVQEIKCFPTQKIQADTLDVRLNQSLWLGTSYYNNDRNSEYYYPGGLILSTGPPGNFVGDLKTDRVSHLDYSRKLAKVAEGTTKTIDYLKVHATFVPVHTNTDIDPADSTKVHHFLVFECVEFGDYANVGKTLVNVWCTNSN